jgi:hypothetical protein
LYALFFQAGPQLGLALALLAVALVAFGELAVERPVAVLICVISSRAFDYIVVGSVVPVSRISSGNASCRLLVCPERR